MSERSTASEIGRELLFSDLKPRTIVWVKPPDPRGRGAMFTFWVHHVASDSVVFYSAVKRLAVLNFRGPLDTVIDDQTRQVHLYEYLGEP